MTLSPHSCLEQGWSSGPFSEWSAHFILISSLDFSNSVICQRLTSLGDSKLKLGHCSSCPLLPPLVGQWESASGKSDDAEETPRYRRNPVLPGELSLPPGTQHLCSFTALCSVSLQPCVPGFPALQIILPTLQPPSLCFSRLQKASFTCQQQLPLFLLK